MSYICPVCGYPDLKESAYYNNDVRKGSASLEICSSCGFQFGWTDRDRHITLDQWRKEWIAKGMPWAGISLKPPINWNPREQLLNVGVKI